MTGMLLLPISLPPTRRQKKEALVLIDGGRPGTENDGDEITDDEAAANTDL